MFTRDMIQGFIDGYVYQGGDPTQIGPALQNYMANHPTYVATPVESSAIVSDVASYRVTLNLTATALAASPLPNAS